MAYADPLKPLRQQPVAGFSQPSDASPHLRYLEQLRALTRALTAGSPVSHIADRAAAALALASGPSADALALLAEPGALLCEVIGSAGPAVGALGGELPCRLLPELETVLTTGAPVVGGSCGPRHPFAPGGSVSLAPLTRDGAPAGALAVYRPADARPPNAAAELETLSELAGVVSLALERERPAASAPAGGTAGRQPAGAAHRLPADRLSAPLCLLDSSLRFQWITRSAAAWWGRTPEQVAGRRLSDLGPDVRPLSAAHLRRALADNAPVVALSETEHAGQRRSWEVVCLPAPGPNGAPAGVLVIGAEAAGQELTPAAPGAPDVPSTAPDHAALLAAVFDAIPYLLLVIGADGRPLMRNRAAERALGTPPVAGAAQPIGDFLAGLDLHDADGRALGASDTAVSRALRGEHSRDAHSRFRSPHNGEERWAATNAVPVRRADGTLLGAVALMRDITDEVRAQEEREWLLAQVAAEQTRVQTILDLIPSGTVAISPDGAQYTFVNQAAQALATRPGARAGAPLSPEDQPYWDLTTPSGQRLPRPEHPLFQALRDRQIIQGVELAIRRPDGRLTPVLISAAPLTGGADGAPGGAVAIFQDITQRKEAERLKDDFLAMASHDLRTPLTVIAARAQMLRRQLLAGRAGPEQAAEGLGSILDQALHLSALADTMLDVTRIQDGRFQVHPARTDLAGIIQQVVHRMAPGAPGHLLVFESPDAGLPGMWEAARLEQVVQNLVQNAIKYSPDGGVVTIRAWREQGPAGAQVVLTVADQGIGIPPEERALVFERLGRGAGARLRGLGGTGLGLYICRGIIQAHGGGIAVEEAPDGSGGSLLRVTLPG